MEKGYEAFVEELRYALLKETGYEEEKVYYKHKDDYPPTAGDRLFIECAEKEETREVCALYVKDLYERYQQGVSLDSMVREAMGDLEKMHSSGFFEKAMDITEYNKIKGDLFIRLLNVNRCKRDLQNAIYRVVGDIALVLYMKMGEMDNCITSIKIKEDVVEKWGRDREQVFEEALLNTYFISPPRIYYWEKLLFNPDYTGENFMDLMSEHTLKKDNMGNCLSTAKRTNGAVAIFLPGVAKRLSELIGGSFYMVFTSIHEVMIHNEKFADPENLRNVLRDTLEEATPEEDFLTLYIYHYDKDTETFSFM